MLIAAMSDGNKGGLSIKIVLALILLGFIGFLFLALVNRSDEGEAPAQQPQQHVETWRCHACARIAGKAWTTCKTLMARGPEDEALARIKERVCSEAQSADKCSVTQAKCKQIDGVQVKSAVPRSRDD